MTRSRKKRRYSTLANSKNSRLSLWVSADHCFFSPSFLPERIGCGCAAASKRNLSPQDTDVIELTLTTIYEFDKLLHLLRDRSENLDLLGIRLTWEEQRCAAWVDRRQLLSDLQAFLSQRARWSPSVYDALPQAESPIVAPTLTRRGSAASLASQASSSFPSGFSRSARFKQAEALSREAAQFAGRISSLRHGKIAAAGKALDRLIDNSKKPVPDEILDEQDKLEEQGINEMEHVGRFIMSVVTQWRKYGGFSLSTCLKHPHIYVGLMNFTWKR